MVCQINETNVKLRNCGAVIKSCDEEYVYYDKKLRERHYKFKKYIIVLEDNAPFHEGEEVMIISELDFRKFFHAIKKLKKDKEELLQEIKSLKFDKTIKNEKSGKISFKSIISSLKS